jgi:hypothetical protein
LGSKQARAFKRKENALKDLLAELRKVPAFNVMIKTAEILISGYIQTGKDRSTSKFDFGPMNTTFSANQIEGFRMRVGGMTTANFHKQPFCPVDLWLTEQPTVNLSITVN